MTPWPTFLVRVLLVMGVVAVGCSSDGSSPAVDAQVVERPEWAVAFDAIGTAGTFAVRQVGTDTIDVVNPERASTGYLPASTFKILNSLIILETGVADSVDQVVEWDGVDRGIEAWNRDHSLRSGIEVSAVWLYQHHARAVGEQRMAEHVAAAGYGNESIGGAIDEFWLNGDVRISALEQLDVVEALMLDALPFGVDHQAAVRDILVRERGDGWAWLHKTGTALAAEPTIGWLVGATQYDGKTWVFALNLDVETIDRQARIEIARELLVDVGALPPP